MAVVHCSVSAARRNRNSRPAASLPSRWRHSSVARYGTLIAWAKQLGRSVCASMLQKNLDEEKAVDKKLTALAESSINRKAA